MRNNNVIAVVFSQNLQWDLVTHHGKLNKLFRKMCDMQPSRALMYGWEVQKFSC